jgi:hypothetical protein
MDRVDLAWQFHKVRMQAWRLDKVPYWQEARIALGRLADGRWYADHTRVPGGAYVSEDEQEVRAVLDDWLTDGGRWVPTPAAFDPNGSGQPADGRRWRASGATWLLDE